MRTRIGVLVLLLALVAVPAVPAVVVSRVTVGTSATLIYTAPIANMGRVVVRNPSTVSVYVGPSGVTTATGFEIAAGDALGINLALGDTLYGVVAAATQVVHTISGANPQ